MRVISAKRLKIILLSVFLGLFAFSFQIADVQDNETIQTSSIPSSGKVIVIDAGHGKPDEGAQSSSRDNRSGN